MTQSNSLCGNCSASNRATAKFCKVCGNPLISLTLLKQRYQILSVIGQGGFGAIYQAEDTHFANRPKRAVKEMLIQSHDPHEQQQAIEAFKQEGLLLAGLMHPNLPRIYEHFEEGGRWYLVMDYINGETLEDCVQASSENKLPLQRVLHFAIQLCTVLDYLHSQQPPIIFRDLKPANVMVTSDDHLYLIDFGIARIFKPGQTKDTSAFGSPGYAAPEQYGKAQTTERADIYGLGATLHRLLSGLDPSENPFHFSPLDLAQDAPTGPALAKLIERMVAMDVQKRPPSVQAIKQSLQHLAQQPVKQAKSHPGQSVTNASFPVKNGQQWDICEEKWRKQELVTARLIGVKKNGLVVDVDGLRGFVPRSHISQTLTEQDLQDRVGNTLQLKILKIDRAQNLFTLSERLAAKKSLDANKPPLPTPRPSGKSTSTTTTPAPSPVHSAPPSQPTVNDYINKSKALIELKRYQEALAICELAIRLDPSSSLLHVNKAAALIGLGRYQQAFDACNQALQYDPQNALAHYNASVALIKLERYQQALDACNQALQLDPQYTKAHYNASEALIKLGRYQQALDACEQALRLDPSYSSACVNKAAALIGLERYQQALATCEQAIRLDPSSPLIYANKAVALIGLERYQEGLATCEQAIRLDPSSPLIYINKSKALIGLGRYQQAFDACNQALRLDPQHAKAHHNAGVALVMLERYREALDACNQALRYDPQNAKVHSNASEALCKLGDYQQALGACEQAIRLDPSYSLAYVNKSWALIELGRYQEALNACDQALQHDPQSALAHYNASEALIRLGRYQQALDACERALRLDPQHAKARINRAFLHKKLRGY